MSRTSEGHAARGSDVDDEVDHWVVLVLEEIGMHKRYALTQAVLQSTWELGLWPVTGDEKILLGPLCKVLAMLIDLGEAVVG